MPNIAATVIVPPARLACGLAETLLKGISAADFAREPAGVKTNHPAWCYGHLSIYPNWILGMIDLPALVKPRPEFDPLFANKTESRHDPDNAIYPAMETITAFYFDRYNALISALPEIDDSVLARPNPTAAMKDRLPTVGAAVNFMLNNHVMFHLGQVSAWRRKMGLGSAM